MKLLTLIMMACIKVLPLIEILQYKTSIWTQWGHKDLIESTRSGKPVFQMIDSTTNNPQSPDFRKRMDHSAQIGSWREHLTGKWRWRTRLLKFFPATTTKSKLATWMERLNPILTPSTQDMIKQLKTSH